MNAVALAPTAGLELQETASLDLKSDFDPANSGEWCELLKDKVNAHLSGRGHVTSNDIVAIRRIYKTEDDLSLCYRPKYASCQYSDLFVQWVISHPFKPIYMMHKWFARRASCVFRGILLGALKPAGTDIMAEFYKDHAKDPDARGKVIIDPFMGGGTTIVEALRLGCKVVGIDLNPVAWFIVKTQVEPVDLPSLDAAFARLVNRQVAWSGKPLRETLLDLYRTEAPWTLPAAGAPALGASDVIYTYWVKSAPCTSPTCGKTVPLFGDYIVAGKSPTVEHVRLSRPPSSRP